MLRLRKPDRHTWHIEHKNIWGSCPDYLLFKLRNHTDAALGMLLHKSIVFAGKKKSTRCRSYLCTGWFTFLYNLILLRFDGDGAGGGDFNENIAA